MLCQLKMSQKCAICSAVVYTADPQINLDGRVLHKPCAKCSDCKCQITVDNFSKAEVGGNLTLFCHTHYLKRCGESGGSYLDGERFANKADRDVLRGSALEKAAQPEFKAVDGLVTKDIPEGLRYEEFASSFSDALHVTNTNVPSARTVEDFPFEDAAPLDSRRKSLQSAFASANSGGGGGTDFPFQNAVPLEERKRSLAGTGSLSADSPSQTPVAGSSPPENSLKGPPPTSTSSADTSPLLGYTGGRFDAAGLLCGHADFASPSGSSYTGEWLDGLMHGTGRLTLSNGSVYEGQLQGSLYHGHGTFRSCHGYTYEGEWRDGQMHGQGRYTYYDGRIVVGEWSLDVLLKGVTVFPNL